jgi:nucleoside-triphosphatase THEP1
MSNKIIILTGEIQTGKTTLLQQFCKQQNGVAGMLTPIVNDKRYFYDIASNVFFDMEAAANEGALAVGKYLFSKTAFIKASNILVDAGNSNNLHYLIIDEIGPLEIKQQMGFYQCLKQILSITRHYTLVLVARQPLVDAMVENFNLDNPVILTTDEMKAHFRLSQAMPQ